MSIVATLRFLQTLVGNLICHPMSRLFTALTLGQNLTHRLVNLFRTFQDIFSRSIRVFSLNPDLDGTTCIHHIVRGIQNPFFVKDVSILFSEQLIVGRTTYDSAV